MSSTYEKLENNEVKLTITIPPADFVKAITAVYHQQKGNINLPGFRKGKVTQQVIEHRFGKDYFYVDAVNHLLGTMYDAAVKEHSLEVVSRPEFDIQDFDAISKENGAVVIGTVYVKPEVNISKESYIGAKHPTIPTPEVTKEEIDAEINRQRDMNTRLVPVERAIMYGDVTKIDFEGYVDGTPFQGGDAYDYQLTIGSNMFIDTFEDQLVGANIGDQLQVNVTFPADYAAPHLQGKDAMFEVKINEVFEKEMPELDDEFAQDVSEFDTFAEFEEDVKKRITEAKQQQLDTRKNNAILKHIAENTTINIPQAMIETEVDLMLQGLQNQLRMSGQDFNSYLQMTGESLEDMRASATPQAILTVKIGLILDQIIKNESIDATEEEVTAEITPLAERFGMSVEEYLSRMPEETAKGFKNDVNRQKANKLIVENAVEDSSLKLEDEDEEA